MAIQSLNLKFFVIKELGRNDLKPLKPSKLTIKTPEQRTDFVYC